MNNQQNALTALSEAEVRALLAQLGMDADAPEFTKVETAKRKVEAIMQSVAQEIVKSGELLLPFASLGSEQSAFWKFSEGSYSPLTDSELRKLAMRHFETVDLGAGVEVPAHDGWSERHLGADFLVPLKSLMSTKIEQLYGKVETNPQGLLFADGEYKLSTAGWSTVKPAEGFEVGSPARMHVMKLPYTLEQLRAHEVPADSAWRSVTDHHFGEDPEALRGFLATIMNQVSGYGINVPALLAVVGRQKSGKSTLMDGVINAVQAHCPEGYNVNADGVSLKYLAGEDSRARIDVVTKVFVTISDADADYGATGALKQYASHEPISWRPLFAEKQTNPAKALIYLNSNESGVFDIATKDGIERRLWPFQLDKVVQDVRENLMQDLHSEAEVLNIWADMVQAMDSMLAEYGTIKRPEHCEAILKRTLSNQEFDQWLNGESGVVGALGANVYRAEGSKRDLSSGKLASIWKKYKEDTGSKIPKSAFRDSLRTRGFHVYTDGNRNEMVEFYTA